MGIMVGFLALADVLDEQIETVGVERLDEVIAEATAQHEEMVTTLTSALVEITTNFQVTYDLPGGGTLQPLDEFGRPKKVDYTAEYDVSVPIREAGTAWGVTEVAAAHLTVRQAQKRTDDALNRDWNWQRRHILAAIFTDTTYVWKDPKHGNLTIRGLADGDSVKYLLEGVEEPATDNHYLAQAAAIADATNPYDDIYDELAEHPSNNVSESNPVVAYIATSLKATTKALANFEPWGTAFPNVAMTEDEVQANIGSYLAFGTTVIGVVDGVIIVEMKSMPAGYIIAVATGAGPIVWQREYVPASLKGLRPKTVITDGTLTDYRWVRRAGYAVFNRVGAVAYRIGNGTYAEPSGYMQPLKV